MIDKMNVMNNRGYGSEKRRREVTESLIVDKLLKGKEERFWEKYIVLIAEILIKKYCF